MAALSIEERLAALEVEVARLKQSQAETTKSNPPWWQEIRGRFKDDPAYVEAMQYGREYRESLRPPDYEGESMSETIQPTNPPLSEMRELAREAGEIMRRAAGRPANLSRADYYEE